MTTIMTSLLIILEYYARAEWNFMFSYKVLCVTAVIFAFLTKMYFQPYKKHINVFFLKTAGNAAFCISSVIELLQNKLRTM